MTRKTIRIAIGDHGVQHCSLEIKAYVYGQWAAHPNSKLLRGSSWWDVTHVPSGRRLDLYVAELDRSDAIAIARELDRRTRRLDDPEAPVPSEDYKHIVLSTVAEYIGEGRCR